jgi:hypothetical protein
LVVGNAISDRVWVGFDGPACRKTGQIRPGLAEEDDANDMSFSKKRRVVCPKTTCRFTKTTCRLKAFISAVVCSKRHVVFHTVKNDMSFFVFLAALHCTKRRVVFPFGDNDVTFIHTFSAPVRLKTTCRFCFLKKRHVVYRQWFFQKKKKGKIPNFL